MSSSLWDSELEALASVIHHRVTTDEYGDSDWDSEPFETQRRYMTAAEKVREMVRGY